MGNFVDLDSEVARLLMAKGEVKIYVALMSHDYKIDVLANGVIEGWYGNLFTREIILKNLFREVQSKVDEITSQLKHTL